MRTSGVRHGAKSDAFDAVQQCLTLVLLLCFLSDVKTAALGFRAHSGWTALVALSVSKGVPRVLARRKVHLVEIFIYKFRQPYHTAKRLSPDEGRAFVAQIQAKARRLAYRAIRDLGVSLKAQGYRLIKLDRFGEKQIRRFLAKSIGNVFGKAIRRLPISHVQDGRRI